MILARCVCRRSAGRFEAGPLRRRRVRHEQHALLLISLKRTPGTSCGCDWRSGVMCFSRWGGKRRRGPGGIYVGEIKASSWAQRISHWRGGRRGRDLLFARVRVLYDPDSAKSASSGLSGAGEIVEAAGEPWVMLAQGGPCVGRSIFSRRVR